MLFSLIQIERLREETTFLIRCCSYCPPISSASHNPIRFGALIQVSIFSDKAEINQKLTTFPYLTTFLLFQIGIYVKT